MTNLKKVGLTALAGTLASITAVQAADVSLSGVARMQYNTQSLETSTATEARTTDAFDQNTSITFSASGEMDNGMNASWKHTHSGTAVFSSLVTLDMGDMGKLYMDQGNAGRQGITTIQDKVPNAGEQVWDDTGSAAANHGTVAQGVANVGAGNTLGYSVTSGMMTLSAGLSYNNGSQESVAVTIADIGGSGLTVGAGAAVSQNVDLTTEDDVDTVFATYTMGSITVGAQSTSVDAETASQDIKRKSYGVSMAVNENFSISYGVSDTEFDESGLVDEENSGMSASFTTGGMTIGLVHNSKDNEGGTSATDREGTELKLTLAF
jgi:outer membrane protein OmpU